LPYLINVNYSVNMLSNFTKNEQFCHRQLLRV